MTNFCPFVGVPVGAAIVKVPAACVFTCVRMSVVSELAVIVVAEATAVTRGTKKPLVVPKPPLAVPRALVRVKVPMVAAVMPMVPVEGVKVHLVLEVLTA